MSHNNIDQVDTAGPAVSRFSYQVIQAIRNIEKVLQGITFKGAFDAASFLWIPATTGRRGPARFEAPFQARTDGATPTRIFKVLLRDNAASKVEIQAVGRSTANEGYSTNLEVSYIRNGTSVARVGGGTVTKTNERGDVVGFNFSVTTEQVGNDVYLTGLVTGDVGRRIDWTAWVTVWEQPTLP